MKFFYCLIFSIWSWTCSSRIQRVSGSLKHLPGLMSTFYQVCSHIFWWFLRQVFTESTSKKRTTPSGPTGHEHLALQWVNGVTTVAREDFQKLFVRPPIDLANELVPHVTSPDKHGAGGILPSAFCKWTLISSTLGHDKAPRSSSSDSDTEPDSQYDKETENIQLCIRQARSTANSPQANSCNSVMPLQVQVPIVLKTVQHSTQETVCTPPRTHASTFGSLSPVTLSPQEKAKKGRQKTQMVTAAAMCSLHSHNTQHLT